MISIALIAHWTAALFLIAMASFALMEAKSASLIPKSLFLWPLMGLLFGLLALLSSLRPMGESANKLILLTTGITVTACSLQALLVNIRKISRWPSGAVWLTLILITLASQIPYAGAEEARFHTFFRRLSGFVWGAIGVTKVLSERSVAQEAGIPSWIFLLYVEAILIASSPY